MAEAVHAGVNGYDGMVQIMPFTCMPELVAQSILPEVGRDYRLPVMTLILDEHSGRRGVHQVGGFCGLNTEGTGEKRMNKQIWLGVDVGSVSTNLVVLDGAGQLMQKIYIRTNGDPIGSVQRALDELRHREIETVSGLGITGSGRQLIAAAVGADLVKNEITAHAVAAAHFYPDVQTIMEIGGQDSKLILMRQGVAVDFAMNTVCAAGTAPSWTSRLAG